MSEKHTWLSLGAWMTAITVSIASAAEPAWQQTIALRDHMRRFVFPEELLGYEVKFPGTFGEEALRLSEAGVEREFQLANAERDGRGNLSRATVLFRTGLGKGQSRTFLLEAREAARSAFPDRVTIVKDSSDPHVATLTANRLQVRVPYGAWEPRARLRDLPAPILQIARQPGAWVGRGALTGDLRVERIEAGPVEDGNLRLIHRIAYHLEGGRRYVVNLTVWHDEGHVTIDEQIEGFEAAHAAAFKFSFKAGLEPNGRLLVTNGGYNVDRTGRWRYSGRFDEGIEKDGALPFQLGIWSPHSGTCVGAVTFWSDRPEATDAILFARYRTHEWTSPRRYVWDAADAPENIRWYQKDGDKFALAPLVTATRHWAMALREVSAAQPIAIESQDGSRQFYWRARVDMQGLPGNKQSQAGGGPEVRLYQKLTEFSLNWVKDLVLDWNEAVDAPLPPAERAKATMMSAEDYRRGQGIAGKHNWHFVEHYWGRHLGGATELGRAQPGWFYDYAVSRAKWTPEQRREVRAILVHWISSVMLRDGNQAHIAMLSGHPNFIIDTLFAGVYCAVFPNHPDAPKWKAAFLRMLDEWLLVFQRDADPARNLRGGRWVENIACYSQAALKGLRQDIEGFRAYDGSDIVAGRPRIADWLRWHMNALVTPMELVRDYPFVFTPPEGSHAREALFALGRASETGKDGKTAWEFHGLLYDYAQMIAGAFPELAAELKFCLTRGREGRKPALTSALFRDYGAILRHDFAGPREAYVNIQQIGAQDYTLPGYRNRGTMNYRWSGEGNGAIYYAARGRIWSWNDYEVNGDRFDITQLPAFAVNGRGLGYHPTDGVLYDFGEVQFYRARGSRPEYRSRDVMMVRDDFLAIWDDVAEGAKGTFHWSNPIGEMPAIHSVRQGAGGNLHVVEPRTQPVYTAESLTIGARLERTGEIEHVCLGARDASYRDSRLLFRGRTGYARSGMLAVFEGESIEYEDFGIEISGGEFGASAELQGDTISGRVAGRQGGQIRLRLPQGFDPSEIEVRYGGKSIVHRIEGQHVLFSVKIDLSEGHRSYVVSKKQSQRGRTPL